MVFYDQGKEKSLIIEYDGIDFHFDNPKMINQFNFTEEYCEYDKIRMREIESYGYEFLRITKFSLLTDDKYKTPVEKMNQLLMQSFK